jgi:alpha-ketoglutarate-dependent taurine dioxygenase
VRTNPVTGWKSLFGAGHQVHAGWIDNVTETESEVIKAYCESTLPDGCFQHTDVVGEVLKLIAENHDLQVRFKWNKNDLAIWDKSVLPDPSNCYHANLIQPFRLSYCHLRL